MHKLKGYGNIPSFIWCVSSVWNGSRTLAKSGKWCEDGGTRSSRRALLESGIYGISSKTFDCVSFEVWCGSAVLWVLIMSNAPFPFTTFSSTLEVVILPAILVSNLNFGLEETVDRRVPSLLEVFYITHEWMRNWNEGSTHLIPAHPSLPPSLQYPSHQHQHRRQMVLGKRCHSHVL